jgi:hypothetical protein
MQAKLKTFLSLNKGKQENIDNYFNKLSIKSINVTLHCIHPISFRLIYFRFLINLQGKERKVFLAQTTASPKRQPPWATAVSIADCYGELSQPGGCDTAFPRVWAPDHARCGPLRTVRVPRGPHTPTGRRAFVTTRKNGATRVIALIPPMS